MCSVSPKLCATCASTPLSRDMSAVRASSSLCYSKCRRNKSASSEDMDSGSADSSTNCSTQSDSCIVAGVGVRRHLSAFKDCF